MLPTRRPERTVVKTFRDRDFILRPLRGEDALLWMELQTELGKVMAESMGATSITRENLRLLMMGGYKLAAMALGGDYDFAAEQLDEDERREVIAAQDELQKTELIEPYLAIEQAAARAYLGAG